MVCRFTCLVILLFSCILFSFTNVDASTKEDLIIEEAKRRQKLERQQRERARREQRRLDREKRSQERKEQQERFFGAEEEENDENDEDNAYLYPRPPRDILDGTISAVQTLVVSGTAGVASLLSFPIIGFQYGGWVGVLIGMITGSISFAGISLAGTLYALHQVIIGLWNTPKCIHSTWKGMLWDSETRTFSYYNMTLEKEELSSESSFRAARQRNKAQKTGTKPSGVTDLSFYELLGVSATASSKEIKKAYYKKAKDVHPDKRPDDEEAAEKFRKLNVAYQTLSDDEKRAAYDLLGESSVDEGALFDPYVFFAVLFGSQLVEQYVGDLTMASIIDQIMKFSQVAKEKKITIEDFKPFWETRQYKPRKRQLEIAQNLISRTEDYVNGQAKEAFRDNCRLEAQAIADTPFGGIFLKSIGAVLRLEANQFLGFRSSILGINGIVYMVSRKIFGIRQIFSMVGSTLKMGNTGWHAYREYEIMNNTSKEKLGGSAKQKADEGFITQKLEELAPGLIETILVYITRDVTSTLKGACLRLFSDAEVPMDTRVKRAEAIVILAEEFSLAGGACDGDDKTCRNASLESDIIKTRAEVAFKVSVMKATGQQDMRGDSEEMIRKATKQEQKKRLKRK